MLDEGELEDRMVVCLGESGDWSQIEDSLMNEMEGVLEDVLGIPEEKVSEIYQQEYWADRARQEGTERGAAR